MDIIKIINKFKSIPYLGITVIVLTLLIITIFGYHNISESNKQIYLIQARQAYEKRVISSVDRYEVFSEYLYHKLIDDVVLETMYNASTGNELTQGLEREKLYQYLLDDYNLIIDYDYRQLHFHLPNGNSFLRFHTPQTFGDNLFELREAIRIVNTELIYVSGFEEGRIYNGYRFVYPLFYNDTHVGSVEISISISTVIDTLYNSEPDGAYFFIMKKEVVESLVFDEYLANYFETSVSNQYLYDRLVYDQFKDVRTFLTGNQMEYFYNLLNPNIQNNIQEEKSFFEVTRYHQRYYTTHFISIQNINNEHVGYLLVTYEDTGYQDIIVQDIIVYILILLFFLISYITLFIYIRDKKRIILLSQTDPLTGLYNRLHFNDTAFKEIERSKRYNNDLSLIIMDIDFFKDINDTHGHLTGDVILKEISSILKNNIRRYDVISRWGGEEFALLLPQTHLDNAIKVAEKIQKLVKEYPFSNSIQISLSYGISYLTQNTQTIEDMLARADRNLYKAKSSGRNKIIAD